MGRPRTFKREIGDVICERLADGESLREICRDEGMPGESTVRGWALDDAGKSEDYEGFAAQYARARQIGYDVIAEQLLDIADDGTNDWMEKRLQNGESIEVPNHEHINRSRLRVDTRKWLLSKMLPKRYGDRSIIQGDNDADPVTINAKVEDARSAVRAVVDLATRARTSGVSGADEVDSGGAPDADNPGG